MSNYHRCKRAAADWSSLSPGLVNSVGDILLADGDVDYYMSLRAVCHTWRAATDDPRGRDPRFRPRGWAMLGSLDGSVAQDTRRLFLNVNTGRFLWKDLPLLRGYACLAGHDVNGLLVLRAKSDSKIWVLNPITGYLVRLALSLANLATTLKVVFRVDLPLHAITSIGNCAVFLGRRCLSVDAGKLPGIQGNCIYYVGGGWEPETRGICMYRVEDGSHERLFEPPYDTPRRPHPHICWMVAVLKFPPQRPLSLLQVLMDYSKYAPGHGSGCRDWQY